MGVHAISTLTAISAQEIVSVTDIFSFRPDDPRLGRRSGPDFGLDAAQTGMLASSEKIDAVAALIEAYDTEPCRRPCDGGQG
ncbi:MAG: bifunctional hydroxymethylpyrimidine kinase/phosphomethylpyrimidine kinase [Candidatus Dormibacteraceae bacterium]